MLEQNPDAVAIPLLMVPSVLHRPNHSRRSYLSDQKCDTPKNGAGLLLDILKAEGIDYIFGNPGTTEMPLMQALSRYPGLSYILGLQETAVVAMADGYAQASGKPAFVNLHTAGGLGHAMGALLHARVAQTPILVTAGQQDTRHSFADPLLGGNLVKISEPAVKWAHEISHPEQIPVLVRRALQASATAPCGPVFLSLPIDVLTKEVQSNVGEGSKVNRAMTAGGLQELADALASVVPGKLAIVAGDEITRRDAIEEITSLAEVLGAKVHGPSWFSVMSFPTDHPLWAGNMPSTAEGMRDLLADYDAVFLVGGHSFVSYLFTEGPAIPPGYLLYQLSEDASELGRTYATRLSCVGNVKSSLQALLPILRSKLSAHDEAIAAIRLTAAFNRVRRLSDLEQQSASELQKPVISPFTAAQEVLRALRHDTAVVDEAPATMNHVRRALERWPIRRYFLTRSGILGWGLPAAVGVSLGLGRSPVVALLGDGSSLYSPQGLWSAAKYKVPVTFIVMNNAEYNILKKYAVAQGFSGSGNSEIPGLEITSPSIDFMALAASMGINARRVARARDIAEAVATGIASNEPNLIEIVIGTD